MSENDFIDYYELLQLSPNADTDTIERIFRHFARKYHPDNRESGDSDRFRLVVEAHRTLTDPESRAAYDVRYQEYWNRRWNLASAASARRTPVEPGDMIGPSDSDQESRDNLLSILYVQRRRDMKKPGLGDFELARLLSIPLELVEFHVWYLRAKGWIERLDTGQLAITALGVDQVEEAGKRSTKDRMLTSGRSGPRASAGGQAGRSDSSSANIPSAAGGYQEAFNAFLASP